jgi:hypothetical protein
MIFVGESNLERRLKEAYVQNSLVKHYFAHLYAKGKVKSISLKKGFDKVEGVSNLCVGKKVAHKGHIKRA